LRMDHLSGGMQTESIQTAGWACAVS
jgi:hypothetical protein